MPRKHNKRIQWKQNLLLTFSAQFCHAQKEILRAFPSLCFGKLNSRSGRAFQPSLTLILPLHFVPLQNFGLSCPNANSKSIILPKTLKQ